MAHIERQSTGIAVNPAFKLYHREFTAALKNAFPENTQIEARVGAYPDSSPIPLVGSADHALLFAIYEGDNWETTFAHVSVLADAFKGSDDIAGANTQRLGVFFIDFEGRHDRREQKQVPDSANWAIVKGQGVPPRAFAKSILINGVDYVVTVNAHSHWIDDIFQKAGLYHIPLATEPVLIDKLSQLKYLTPQVLSELVIGTTDVGGLKEAVTAKRYINYTHGTDVPIAIIEKQRIPTDESKSETKQRFVYGDVQNKPVLIIDDRSDSGESIKTAVDIYCQQGAKEVIVYLTHTVFAKANYYKNFQDLLRNPKVTFVFVSNSLPLGENRISRKGGVDVPYVWENGKNGRRHKKQLEILDIHPFIIGAAKTILEAPTIEEARNMFEAQRVLLEMRNPLVLFEELTGKSLPQRKTVAIYSHGQLFPLPPSTASPST